MGETWDMCVENGEIVKICTKNNSLNIEYIVTI